MHPISLFITGMLFCNSVPHLVCGLQGQRFPTPFAKPRGIGLSSPLVNFVWGFANLLVALALYARHPAALDANADTLAMLAGVAVLGVFSAVHFGKVRNAA
ncbi:MAG TPA: hypothetical protein VGC69_18440 [Bordetella sp.]